MKKNLLVALMLFAFLGLHAQIVQKVNPAPALSKGFHVVQPQTGPVYTPVVPYKPYKNYPSNKDILSLTKVPIGSSTNPYTLLVEQQNCMTYNGDVDLIMFTHRQTHTNPGNSGYIQCSFSSDEGVSWDNNIVWDSPSGNLGRYPSGVIYNPSGNTNVGDAFAISVGPITDGSGWQGNYYASMKFDSTESDKQFISDVGVDYDNLVREHMNVDSEGRIRILGSRNTDDGQYYTSYTSVIMKGDFNSGTNSWDWSEDTFVPDFTMHNGRPEGYRSPGMAWSEDGETGYIVNIGRNTGAVDPSGYHPIIMKTVDGGDNWTTLPSIDWSMLPAINAELIPVSGPSGITRALFGLVSDAAVDANGRLHFAAEINSAASNHPDSLGYLWTFTNINCIIYHIWETATGWDAAPIDIVWAKDVDAANSPIIGTGGTENLTWDYRLQMTKTWDGTKIGFAWMDTDTNTIDINLYPDILTQIFDVNSGQRTATYNLTGNSMYVGDNYFMFLSDLAGYDPLTQEVIFHLSTSDFGGTDVDPVYHSYLRGARVFVSMNEYNSSPNGNLSVSQNYPNPFNDFTSIDISLATASDVSVEVFNIMGQKVSSDVYQFVGGTHTVQINAQNLSSGIYFYSVRAGENVVTQKMIIR
jgi:hypothetical protein